MSWSKSMHALQILWARPGGIGCSFQLRSWRQFAATGNKHLEIVATMAVFA